MPAYLNNQFTGFRINPLLLQAGIPAYLIGSRPDDQAPCRMAITSLAAVLNTSATIGVIVLEGNIPAVGNLISVRATQTDSGAANVNQAPITAVSINANTGVGTITYTVTTIAAQSTTTDSGQAVVSVPEVPESLNAAYASIPVVLAANDIVVAQERAVTVIFNLGSTITTLAANLQLALNDLASDYVNVNSTSDFSTATAGVYQKQFTLQTSRFYRLNITTFSGGPANVIAKIMV